jgi:hypothetical protein
MADTRELILQRLLAIALLQGPGFKSAVRNRGLRTNEKRPAIIVLDGDEAPVLTHGGRSNRAQNGITMPMTSQIMLMKPEIYILMDEQRPTNEKDEVQLGTDLNTKRVALLKGIAEDAELLSLLGSNGNMIYNGCVTDLKSGMALSGQMRIDMNLTYTFHPTTNQQGMS